MIKTKYTIKNEHGFLVERTKKFQTLQEAMTFVRELSTKPSANSKLVGKPVVEQV